MTGSAVRAALRRVVGGIERKVHLPEAFDGRPIVVSGEARLKFTFLGGRAVAEEYADLLAVAEDFVRPDDVVWDVGSNVGVFSIAAASVAGPGSPVLAFEPDLYLCGLLRRSLRLRANTDLAVTVVPIAAAGKVGMRHFQISSEGRTGNRLLARGPATGSETGGRLVPCFTLDSLLADLTAPDVLKVDVEGGEAEVMHGAERLLGDVRPIVYCEVRQTNVEHLTETFDAMGYNLFRYRSEARQKEPIDACDFNTLAIPAEADGR